MPRQVRFLPSVVTLAMLLGSCCFMPCLAGCYTLLGVKHNYTVADKLENGMSLDAALAVLDDGGVATVRRTLTRSPTSGWAAGWGLEPEDFVRWWEEREGQTVHRVVIVRRFWGFMGFGEFLLFFDEAGRLIGHDLRHEN